MNVQSLQENDLRRQSQLVTDNESLWLSYQEGTEEVLSVNINVKNDETTLNSKNSKHYYF